MLLHTGLHVSAKTSHLQALRRTLKQNINYCIYVHILPHCCYNCVPLSDSLRCDVKCKIVFKVGTKC
jgi:hypothetical protein